MIIMIILIMMMINKIIITIIIIVRIKRRRIVVICRGTSPTQKKRVPRDWHRVETPTNLGQFGTVLCWNRLFFCTHVCDPLFNALNLSCSSGARGV